MLGIDRRALSIAWTFFLFALVLLVLYYAGRVIIIFAIAVIFAHLLSPIVNFIERRFPQTMPRMASLSIVYIALIGAIVGISIPLGTRVSHEAASLARKLPNVIQSDPLGNLPIPKQLEPWRPEVTEFVHDRLNEIGQRIGPMLSSLGTQIISGIGALLAIIIVPILAFFFLKDGAEIRDAIVESFDAPRRPLVEDILSETHFLLIRYIRALVLLSLSTFTFYSLFLAITGAPFPVLLAVISGILEFIPALGPLAAAVLVVIISAANGYSHVILLIIFLGIYRIFQDYVLSPYLMSAGVKIHPLAALFGVLVGAELLGIPGMFFSVPAIAVLRLIINRLRRRQIAAPPPSP